LTESRAFPPVTALRAQRLLDSSVRVAPAAVAGVMAGGRLDGAGQGLIVFCAVLAASLLLERDRYPLQLMPLACGILRGLVPVLGAGMALAVFAFAGNPEPVWSLAVPILGAWLVTLFATWFKARFATWRQVRVGVIGSAGLARGLDEELRNAGVRGYAVVGWIAGEHPPADRGKGGPRRLGSLGQVRQVVQEHSIDLLVHSSGGAVEGEEPRHSRLEVFERVAAQCLDLRVRLIEASQLYEERLGHVPLGQSNAAWFQYLLHPRYRPGSLASKRTFDIVAGSLLAIVSTPVMAIFAVAIKFVDGGPIFYRQRRVGEGGREFEMIKLRSMRVLSEADGPRWADAEDSRITWVGRIMRSTHIDELPQLWNVLRGEMTLVGPRPERPELIAELERTLSYYDRRHLVQPGIAGWAQARCGYGGSEEGTGWKLCHDLFYLKHRSVYFDFVILLENVRVSLQSGVEFDVRAPQEQFILGRQASEPQRS
jgi:exopolysaccharide biosynthesis polyprenyl glycosylphosphotransferase